MNDPIVEEVRRIRDAHAARFNYDLDAIFRDLKEQERKSGYQFIRGVARKTTPESALQSPGSAGSVSDDCKRLVPASASEPQRSPAN